MSKIIKEFTNEEDGVSSVVTEIKNGFSVRLRDDDAGKYIGVVIMYQSMEAAIEKASSVIGYTELKPD